MSDGKAPSDAATLDDTHRRATDPLIGASVGGRFQVRALLGQGGMGAVYAAWQPSVQREVALKVLHRHFATDETLVRRFEREVQLCAQLVHPNVVVVHDAGVADGLIFMAMERLQGRTVGQWLEQGPMDPARACRLAAQVCAALAAAHAKGVIHRDIKPSNIMVVDSPGAPELVKVLDFGIASIQDGTRLTQTHGLMGSPNAIAPELIRSPTNLTPKADLYAVGTLLFEMVTGRPPFGADTAQAVFACQVSGDVPPLPSLVPPRLAQLIGSLMNAEPSRRPESAEVVQRLLSDPMLLAEASAPAPGLSSTAVPGPAARPGRWWLAGVLGVMVLGALGLVATRTRPAAPLEEPTLAPLPPVSVPVAPVDVQAPEPDAGVADVDAGRAEPSAPVRRNPPPRRRSDYEP
jgi:eukaryotic-like serine/threonine-protein kinase